LASTDAAIQGVAACRATGTGAGRGAGIDGASDIGTVFNGNELGVETRAGSTLRGARLAGVSITPMTAAWAEGVSTEMIINNNDFMFREYNSSGDLEWALRGNRLALIDLPFL
jgi:hypothetical protein